MRNGPLHIFEEAHGELRPGASLPELRVEFFAFTSIKNTIRMRQGKLLVRLSDLLEGAPEPGTLLALTVTGHTGDHLTGIAA